VWCFEIFSRAARIVDDIAVAVDDHMRRGESLEHLYVDGALERDGAERRTPRDEVPNPSRTKRTDNNGQADAWRDVGAAAEDTVLPLDGNKEVVELADVLRQPKKQVSIRTQCVVKRRDDPVLEVDTEVNQQVATGDQIDAREGRITDDVVRRKYAKLANILGDNEAAAVGNEKSLAPLRRDAVEQIRRIARGARNGQGPLVDVSGEELHARNCRELVHMLAQQNGDREHFLTRRTARNPDAYGLVGAAPRE
jgi:hypothetical protein